MLGNSGTNIESCGLPSYLLTARGVTAAGVNGAAARITGGTDNGCATGSISPETGCAVESRATVADSGAASTARSTVAGRAGAAGWRGTVEILERTMGGGGANGLGTGASSATTLGGSGTLLNPPTTGDSFIIETKATANNVVVAATDTPTLCQWGVSSTRHRPYVRFIGQSTWKRQ